MKKFPSEIDAAVQELLKNEDAFMPSFAKDGMFDQLLAGTLNNGLGDALGLAQFNPFGLPQMYGFPGTEQLSNTQTLFKNMRWYLVSNFRQLLAEMYVEIGLVQTAVDLPVDDALRGGIEITTKQLSEEDIKKLSVSMDRNQDVQTAGQESKWDRLFGGAGIVILTDQDPYTPLDVSAITKDSKLSYRATDMWELFWSSQDTVGYDPSIQQEDFEFYDYYGERLHKSRVMRMRGIESPSFIRPRLRGWGFSIVEAIVRSINQWLKATDLAFDVLDEFKLDVYKIKNLVNTLDSPIGDQKIQRRVQMANQQKNYQNAIVMDGEDEFEYKQFSFGGLSDLMREIRMQVAAELRIPVIKLFGQSVSSGLGSAAQEELENYNSMVEGQVRNKIKYQLLRMVELRCQEIFGFIPDDIEIKFKPLRTLTAEQEENVKNAQFNRLSQLRQSGDISQKTLLEGCNKASLLPMQIDVDSELLMTPLNADDGLAEEGANDPSNPQDVDNPGEGRADTSITKLFPKDEWSDDGEHRTKTRGDESGSKDDDTPPESKPSTDYGYASTNPKRDPATQDTDFKHRRDMYSTGKDARPNLTDEEKLKMKKRNDAPRRMPAPYTRGERISRALMGIGYDLAKYKEFGGDMWITNEAAEKLSNPGKVDEALWKKAKRASQDAFGEIRYPFVTWWYKKQGGKFNEEERDEKRAA